MRNRNSSRFAHVAIGCLGISLLGCESIQSPSPDLLAKAAGAPELSQSSHRGVVTEQPASHTARGSRGRPFKGQIKKFQKSWSVSHFAEEACSEGASLVAGTALEITGNFTHLGKTEGDASAAWDWEQRAAGTYAPVGPTTGPSASILDSSYDFCSAERSASGQVVLERKNGDELHGVIVGGEVYELGFMKAGDGQEQFIEIEITGGTGKLAEARGAFVLHAVASLLTQSLSKVEILDGGWISY